MANYLYNSSSSGETHNGKCLNVSDDSDWYPTVEEYPRDGSMDLSGGVSGRYIDTQWTAPQDTEWTMSGIYNVVMGASYDMYSIHYKGNQTCDIYLGSDTEDLVLSESDKDYTPPTGTWKIYEEPPAIIIPDTAWLEVEITSSTPDPMTGTFRSIAGSTMTINGVDYPAVDGADVAFSIPRTEVDVGGTVTFQPSADNTVERISMRNQYVGGVMPDWSKHTTLTYIFLDSNEFTGSVPPGSFSGNTGLRSLYLNNNPDLTGDVPDISDAVDLNLIYLYDCNFTGYEGNGTGAINTAGGYRVDGNAITSATDINAILADLVSGTVSYTGGTIVDLSNGTNGAPTGQGLTDVTTLEGRYTTVNVNT